IRHVKVGHRQTPDNEAQLRRAGLCALRAPRLARFNEQPRQSSGGVLAFLAAVCSSPLGAPSIVVIHPFVGVGCHLSLPGAILAMMAEYWGWRCEMDR
ncbi:hypothetical protein ABD440_13790, partial [Chromobacterium piscinae]|uniref:hypothetical protein n=1 Tax=Chromobacterium piscinae TaxID=686831 RepID=UPI0031FC0D65